MTEVSGLPCGASAVSKHFVTHLKVTSVVDAIAGDLKMSRAEALAMADPLFEAKCMKDDPDKHESRAHFFNRAGVEYAHTFAK